MRIPGWLRTIRTRLALTYSAVLFGLAALLLGGVYLALSQSIDAKPLDPVTVKKFQKGNGGIINYRPGEDFQAADIRDVQEYVNYNTLETLRTYSIIALAVLFLLSLAVGWWVAGRALRPVERITTTARDISASDLSRRIGATGPRDELRTLADTIDDMLARLQTSFSSQRTLVDDVSHELRNPIAVVQANVDAVLSRDDSTPEERAHSAGVVTRATHRMASLVDDLLATARTRSGAFVDQEVDVSHLAAEVVEEHRLLAEGAGLGLVSRLAPGPRVVADAESLNRALGNILANAIRLSPSGTDITVASGSLRGWAWVAVRDEGPGITADDHERVFQRFGRTHTSQGPGAGESVRSGAQGGHGLGLAISRQVVESHEGHITLTSAPGVGSTFVIWLPDRAISRDEDRDRTPPTDDPLGRV